MLCKRETFPDRNIPGPTYVFHTTNVMCTAILHTLLLPGARESAHVCAEVDQYIDNHWIGHDVLDVGSIVRITLQHRVDEVTQALTVAAGNGTDPGSRLHDLHHQGREVLWRESTKARNECADSFVSISTENRRIKKKR